MHQEDIPADEFRLQQCVNKPDGRMLSPPPRLSGSTPYFLGWLYIKYLFNRRVNSVTSTGFAI